jgi:hypothetical protein
VLFVSNLQKLNNKSLGIVEGYAFAEILEQAYPDINFVYVTSSDVGLEMVA